MENEPQATPAEPSGKENGQLEKTETPAPPETPADPMAQRVTELERQNVELQRRRTEEGRKIARLEAQQTPNASPAEPATSPEEWFNDPASFTKQAVDTALLASEQRQDNKEPGS